MRIFILIVIIGLIYLIVSQYKLSSLLSKDLVNPIGLEEKQYQYRDLKYNFLAETNNKRTGLTAIGDNFRINGHILQIISGAIHYFRMPEDNWRSILKLAKLCGLNVIETYVPWNLHEPLPGVFDFSGMLNLKKFVLTAYEEGLLVIIRPGPYICSEWEFGGLPSWLLKDPNMKVRTTYKPYIKAVVDYFDQLLPIINELQYQNGGPIIAVQLENEYGSYFKDSSYLPFLKKLFISKGIKELLFISDSINGLKQQTIPGVLKTVNFKRVGDNFRQLKKMQPNSPTMVMEFWTGWFDWWGEKHHTLSVSEFQQTLDDILSGGSSVNLYMFFGGTNFGFMNGAFADGGTYHSDITSYDYDALVAENGDLTLKYFAAQKVIAKHTNLDQQKMLVPDNKVRATYLPVIISGRLPIWMILDKLLSVQAVKPVTMEMLPTIGGKHQSYGYILYRCKIDAKETKSFLIKGFESINDRGAYYVNEQLASILNSGNKHKSFKHIIADDDSVLTVDILVENGGRTNWAIFDDQRKGLSESITVNGDKVESWTIYSLEMKSDFIIDISSSNKWLESTNEFKLTAPSYFKTSFFVEDDTKDTYLDMSDWGKGVAFVNDHNLGRYWTIGPQTTLYVPSPWLHKGDNHVIIFEEIQCSNLLKFSDSPKLG